MIHLRLAAVPLAAVASWVAGAIWYGVFGRRWSLALGLNEAQKAHMRAQSPALPILLCFFSELVMALVLFVALGPASTKPLLASLLDGARDGLVLWLGFILTSLTVNYAYQRRSLSLLAIDAGHWLLVLALQGALLRGIG